MICSIIGFPLIGIIGFGDIDVYSEILVPKPPERIMTFIIFYSKKLKQDKGRRSTSIGSCNSSDIFSIKLVFDDNPLNPNQIIGGTVILE